MHDLMSVIDLMPWALATAAPPAGDAPASSVAVENVWDFVVKGGWMMIPIGLCSIIALTVFAERLVSLRRGRIIPPKLFPKLRKVLGDDGDRDAALEVCRKDGSPVADVLAAGIKRLGSAPEVVEKHIQDAGEREVVRLRKYLRVLQVIAAVAPLMGLLGTIFGMITAFQTVAVSGEALGKTELLAGGIYEAMITTAAGLIVAIPVLIAYHIINARIDRLVMEIDATTVDFLEEFAETTDRVAPPAGAGAVSPAGGNGAPATATAPAGAVPAAAVTKAPEPDA